jgi:hypothetical protein
MLYSIFSEQCFTAFSPSQGALRDAAGQLVVECDERL